MIEKNIRIPTDQIITMPLSKIKQDQRILLPSSAAEVAGYIQPTEYLCRY